MPKNRYGATKRLKEIERKRKAQEKIERRQAKNKPALDVDELEGAEQTEEEVVEEEQQREPENLPLKTPAT